MGGGGWQHPGGIKWGGGIKPWTLGLVMPWLPVPDQHAVPGLAHQDIAVNWAEDDCRGGGGLAELEGLENLPPPVVCLACSQGS